MLTHSSTISTVVRRLGYNAAVAAAFVKHAEAVTTTILARAADLARNGGVHRIRESDCMTAASFICLACLSYNAKTHSCLLYNRARVTQPTPASRTSRRRRTAGGGGASYTGYCGGNTLASQCGSTRALSCEVAGMETSSASSAGRRSRSGRRSWSRRRRRRRRAGTTYSYSGFCGGTPFTSQCAFSEGLPDTGTGGLCYGGGRKRSNRARHTSPPDHSTPNGGLFSSQNRIIHIQQVKTHMQKLYKMQCAADALEFVNTAMRYHLNEVIQRLNAQAKRTKGADELAAVTQIMHSYQTEHF